MMILSLKNFMGVMQENETIWVKTWMEKIAEKKVLQDSRMLEEYGDCFEMLFREVHHLLPSRYLCDLTDHDFKEKTDPPFLIIRDGFFTLPYGLACTPDLQKLPSFRKVAIHHKLNHFIDKGPWSRQELFFYALRPIEYTPRKKLVLIVHQDFWDEGEKIVIKMFQDFFGSYEKEIRDLKKIYLLDCFLDRDSQNKYLRICRQYGFPVEGAMKLQDLLYHEDVSQYAFHDLGDGHMSLDSYVHHPLLRNNCIPFIKEENTFPPTAKYYPCSPKHGYYIWPRDASADHIPDPLFYISKQEFVTDFLSKPFLNSRFEKETLMPTTYKAKEASGRKKVIAFLREKTSSSAFHFFHKSFRLLEMKILRSCFVLLALPSFSLQNLKWRGSSVEDQHHNIFDSDLDWSVILKNDYSDWGLSYIVRLTQIFRFLFPNLDTPEFYTEREFTVSSLLNKNEEVAPFIKLCRSLKKMSGQFRMLNATSLDQEKAYRSLRKAMKELGQEHTAPNDRFFPLVFDLDYYFSSLVSVNDLLREDEFSCDVILLIWNYGLIKRVSSNLNFLRTY